MAEHILYQIVEHSYTWNYYGDNNLDSIDVVAFNIDQLHFQNKEDLLECLNEEDEYEKFDREAEEDYEHVYYNANIAKEENDKLKKQLEDNYDEYEQGDGNWSNCEVFETYKEADEYRLKNYISSYKDNPY